MYLLLPRELLFADLDCGLLLATLTLDRTDHAFWRLALPACLPGTVFGEADVYREVCSLTHPL